MCEAQESSELCGRKSPWHRDLSSVCGCHMGCYRGGQLRAVSQSSTNPSSGHVLMSFPAQSRMQVEVVGFQQP